LIFHKAKILPLNTGQLTLLQPNTNPVLPTKQISSQKSINITIIQYKYSKINILNLSTLNNENNSKKRKILFAI